MEGHAAMTCADVEPLVDPFVDAELPPDTLLAVARHAGSCHACDSTILERTALRRALVATLDEELARFEMDRVWPAVARALERRRERDRSAARRWRDAAVWSAPLALAAGLLLAVGIWRGRPAHEPAVATRPESAMVQRTGELRNRAAFDRLWGRAIEVKREPKAGTTVVWVNHVPASAR